MAKRDLDQTWIYNGKFYGPGVVELPDDAAEAIDGKLGKTPDEGAHETEEPKRSKIEIEERAAAEFDEPLRPMPAAHDPAPPKVASAPKPVQRGRH